MIPKRVSTSDAPPEGPRPSSEFDIVRTVWRQKWVFLWCTAVCVGLGALYCLVAPPLYDSSAQLLVQQKSSQPIPGVEPQVDLPADVLTTHQTVIESPLIVKRAIEKADLASLRTLKSVENPTGEIRESLTVTREGRPATRLSTTVLNIRFRSRSPGDAQAVVQAIVDSYQEFLGDSQVDDRKDVRELFTRWKDEIQKQHEEKQAAYDELRDSTPGPLGASDVAVTLSTESLSRIEAKKLEHVVRRKAIERHLEAIGEARKKGDSPRLMIELAMKWASSELQQNRSGTQDQLLQLMLREQMLLAKFGPKHPEVAALRRQIGFAQTERSGGTNGDIINVKADEPFAVIGLHEQGLRHELNAIKDVEKSLTQLLDEEKARIKQISDRHEDMTELRKEISRIHELYLEIVRQLRGLDVLKDSQTYHARVIADPLPGKKVAPRPMVAGFISLFFGLLAGCGLAFVKSMGSTDNAEDIRRRLGVPVVGQLPTQVLDRKTVLSAREMDESLDPMLCAYFRSTSADAEAYRSLRTALYFGSHCEGRQLIQITSPDIGDGKSTIAANLAIAVAQTGKRVLLVGADLRSPKLHELFVLSNEFGLATILDNTSTVADTIQATKIPDLSVITSGPLPSNPAELLSSGNLPDLLAAVRRDYDFVLIDSPPVLCVTDASVIAPHVDGLLLAVKVNGGFAKLRQTVHALSDLQTHVLGVVLNCVPRRSNGEYYRHEQPDPVKQDEKYVPTVEYKVEFPREASSA